MNYIELNIVFTQVDPWREIVISYLAEEGFDSFMNGKTDLKAYISKAVFSSEKIEFLNSYKTHIKSINVQTIEDKNWNEEWEKNFDPVYVGEELAILAPFHNQNTDHQLKVLIQPQMSFGTGHHQTTWLMSYRLLSLNIENKTVLDMGTGTGVLAILAEKLGASNVFAPDIDEWSYHNAIENCELNNCKNIEVALGTEQLIVGKSFDVIIANINKNVLLEQFKSFENTTSRGAILLISGFFKTDVNDLIEAANKYGFIFEKEYHKDEWALVEFIKN